MLYDRLYFTVRDGKHIDGVDARLIIAVNNMAIHYGIIIPITDGYRKEEDQQWLIDNYGIDPEIIAKPGPIGGSWHEYGGAVDLGVNDPVFNKVDLSSQGLKKFNLFRPFPINDKVHFSLTEIQNGEIYGKPSKYGSFYEESIVTWGELMQ